jgi:hypothetical protein
MPGARPLGLGHAIALVCTAALAAVLLFWNLGVRYLWQDEAACAVLAQRLYATGAPRGWDGRNLITMDEFRGDEVAQLAPLAHDERRMIEYFVERGDFKADTTWIGQPWGPFVAAGASMSAFGADTLPARAPFAIAGVLTVVLLLHFARTRFADPRIAWIAVALLLANTYWFLHARQCRYYSTATLGLLATFAAYVRWQEQRRFGAALFVASAWFWFQNDFGSPWPVFAILAADALRADRARWRGTLLTFGALAAAIAPFAVFYELHTRVKRTYVPWSIKFEAALFSTNQFQLPLLIAAVATALLVRGRSPELRGERRIVALALAIVAAKLVWMPTIGPAHFYRYVVDLTPLSAVIVAFVVARIASRAASSAVRTSVAFALAAVQIASSAFAEPIASLLPDRCKSYSRPGWVVRPELDVYAAELAGTAPDPNREAILFLRPLLEPGDEILVNYEDIPWMFYVPNRIRGGLAAFRVLDDRARPPRFVVYRRALRFVHTSIFMQAFAPDTKVDRERWTALSAHVPEIPWGNNPDPGNTYSQLLERYDVNGRPEVMFLEHRAPR